MFHCACTSDKPNTPFHTLTASKIFKTKLEGVSPEQRHIGKLANLELLYGMGVDSFYKKLVDSGLNISKTEAQFIIDEFFTAYPEIKAWHDKVKMEKPKEARTLLGRCRKWDNPPWYGEYCNFIIQGTASDIFKEALRKISIAKPDYLKLLLTAYDEFLFECPLIPVYDMTYAITLVRDCMFEAFHELIPGIPCVVEIKHGFNWDKTTMATHKFRANPDNYFIKALEQRFYDHVEISQFEQKRTPPIVRPSSSNFREKYPEWSELFDTFDSHVI